MTNELTSTKYTFVCDTDECNTLIEVTCDKFDFPSGVTQITCPCGRKPTLLSVEHATIPPINPTKEETMNDTPLALVEKYNPTNTIVVKVAENYENKYVELNTYDVATLHNDNKYLLDTRALLQSRVNRIIDNLTEDFFFSDSMDKDEVLAEICEILDISPTKTIEFSGTMSFSGSIDVPLNEVEGFDLESAIGDIYVDIRDGNVEISDYELYNVEEC
jgi:hypothetical protein